MFQYILCLLVKLPCTTRLIRFSGNLCLKICISNCCTNRICIRILMTYNIHLFILSHFSISPSQIYLLFTFTLTSIYLCILSSYMNSFFIKYISWEMTPTSIDGEIQVSISGGSHLPADIASGRIAEVRSRSMSCTCMTRTSQQECRGILELNLTIRYSISRVTFFFF